MPLKTKGGKLLVKGGKLTQCCCEEPDGCCLYPNIAGFPPFGNYPPEDLPATVVVTIDGTPHTLNRMLSEPYVYSGTWSGGDIFISTELTPLDGMRLSVQVDELDFAAYFIDCLITTTLTPDINPPGSPDVTEIADPFPDTLYFTAPLDGIDPIVLTRISLCEWAGEGERDGNDWTVRLSYGGVTSYKWSLHVVIDPAGIIIDAVKDDPQSSPVGDYDLGDYVISDSP